MKRGFRPCSPEKRGLTGLLFICILVQMRNRKRISSCCPDLMTLIKPNFFKALSDPNRVALLVSLANRKCACSVSEMAKCCPVDLSVVSRHLGILKQAGLVTTEKKGKEVFYTVKFPEIIKTLKNLAKAFRSCAC